MCFKFKIFQCEDLAEDLILLGTNNLQLMEMVYDLTLQLPMLGLSCKSVIKIEHGCGWKFQKLLGILS